MVSSVYMSCNYTPEQQRKFLPPLLSVSVSEELSAALLRFSDVAAPPRGLSGFIGLCSGSVRPYIPSFGACTDVPGRRQRHLSGSVQPLIPVPDGAAPPRALPHSHRTRPQSRRASLQVSEFRGGLHDFLRPFTPPLLACRPPWRLVVISPIADSSVRHRAMHSISISKGSVQAPRQWVPWHRHDP